LTIHHSRKALFTILKERVLITGASGFVGYHLIEAALRHNLEVFIAIRKSSQIDHLKHFDIQYIYPDFNSIESLQKALQETKFDYIIHAAGTTKAPDQAAYNLVNATYTINLASAAHTTGVKKFLFISSLAALGPAPNGVKEVTETQSPNPVTNYGKSKLQAEYMLNTLSMAGLPLTVLRPTAVYGPREKDIFIIFKTFRQGLEPYIGSKPQQLSFVYGPDLAEAAVQLLFVPANDTYNISDGKVYDRYALANIAKRFFNKKTLKIHIPVFIVKIIATLSEKLAKKGSTPALNREKLAELTATNWACNIDKLKQAINYQPKYDLEKGLTESLAWYKENKWL
jgi:nucleoside-diphosphate-sugar epimerase